MGKLIEFYKQHRRLFLAQKHQNTLRQERGRDAMIVKFLQYCEFLHIYHTKGIRKQTAIDFFNTPGMLSKSNETRRKYFLVTREFYKRYSKIKLIKEEILK